MNLEPWIILGIAVFGGLVWLIRLEGTVKSHKDSKADASELTRLDTEIQNLKDAAKEHGQTRDLVMELRGDMRGLKTALETYSDSFKEAVRELTAQIKDARRPTRAPRS